MQCKGCSGAHPFMHVESVPSICSRLFAVASWCCTSSRSRLKLTRICCDRLEAFLSGMNPMISSRNCTLQQSSVNRRDQCVHRECHCKICRQVCMSFICMSGVLHYNSGWLSADTLQAVDRLEALHCTVCGLTLKASTQLRSRMLKQSQHCVKVKYCLNTSTADF